MQKDAGFPGSNPRQYTGDLAMCRKQQTAKTISLFKRVVWVPER